MEQSRTAFWLNKDKLVPLYEGDTHCYFLLFHYDLLDIPENEVLKIVNKHGFVTIQEAQDKYFDPWEISEFDPFWVDFRLLAYSRGLIRLGIYKDISSGKNEFYASCKDLKSQKHEIMDFLVEFNNKFNFNRYGNFSIEDMKSELSRHKRGAELEGCCIEAHSLDEALLELDSY